MTYRLGRENRLRKKLEFSAVYSNRRLGGDLLTLYYRTGCAESKAGFVVSKKVDKRAVERNRIKRILRECYRKNRSLLPEGTHVILIARPGKVLNYCGLHNETFRLFKRIWNKEGLDRLD